MILPRLAAQNGWDYADVLLLVTVAGIVSVAGQLILGRICGRKGPKFTIVLCLFLTAGFMLLYGSARHMWFFAIGLFGAVCCAQSFSYIGANALIANWFPKKKGIAMGFVSMGAPVSTIVMVSVLTLLINGMGLFRGMLVVSAILAAMAVVCLFVVHDKPEQCGETPDNIPLEEMAEVISQEEKTRPIRTGELFKMRGTWMIIAICGSCSLALTGVMAQFIVRYTDSGFRESQAIFMMSVCAAIGIFGSMLMGNIENRLGTKRAYALFALVFAAALLINFTDVPAFVYLSIPLLGCVITILQIFLTSFEVSVFGRVNFKQANAVIFPCVSAAGQCSFVIISACMRLFGEVRFAYPVFAAFLIISAVLSLRMKETAKV